MMIKTYEYKDYSFRIEVVLNKVVEPKPDGDRQHFVIVDAINFLGERYCRVFIEKIESKDNFEDKVVAVEERIMNYVDGLVNFDKSKEVAILKSLGYKPEINI